ncbi:MAG: carbohydrate binding domain-containing protein, partial [Armatimonadota bacterium]
MAQPADDNDPPNLAPNPSFEQGTDGNVTDWRFWAWAPEGEPRTSEGVWDNSVGRTGSSSLKVINESEKDIGTWTNRRGDSFIPVEPGSIYTVSAYFMVESADPVMTTNFRVGFCTIGDDGEVTYMPKEMRVQVSGEDRRFTEANTWKQLALTARVPEDATHLGMDIDLIGTGTGWIDDVQVVKGYDASAFGGEMPSPRITIAEAPDLDPPSAETPLSVTFQVESPLAAREMTLECEVLDYWFRPSVFTETLQMEADEVRTVTIDFDEATRERLFHMRCTAAANRFQVTGVLRENDEKLTQARNNYSFKNMINEYETLPALEGATEHIDDLFGSQRLVDVVHCYDPDDPHPYMEGGRGMASKSTGAVPQIDWKDMFREPHEQFTSIETILGAKFRVTHGWGWFGYKLNREGLEPGKYYVAVVEYPEDTGRTYTIFNTGTASSAYGGYGFHTGRTLGDHWTRTLNSEYTDYPLSGQIERWYSFFRLPEGTWRPGGGLQEADPSEGFWFIVGGVGASQDPLAAGAAVRTIKLYEIDDIQALFPQIEEPPLEVGRRNLFLTNESDGISKFLTNAEKYDLWALTRLYELKFLGMNGIAPNSTKNIEPLLRVNHEEALGLKIFPRMMIEREFLARIGVPPEGIAKDPRGLDRGRTSPRSIDEVPDILHPATARGIRTLMTDQLGAWLKYPDFAGMMLYKHYGVPFPVSFSEYAMDLFEQETGETVEGDDPQARRDWLLANLKEAYYDWWYAKKHDFMMQLRDHLRTMRDDLDLYYFAWHSDDDYPFSCGRLRYSSAPMMDKIYVPGTNILLVPSFTVPPEKWTEEQKRR